MTTHEARQEPAEPATATDLTVMQPYVLQFEVERLMRAYCACIDEDRLEQWPAFFVEDGRYQITTRTNADRGLPANALSCDSAAMMRDRVVSLRHANVYGAQSYRHIISNIDVRQVSAQAVSVQTHYLVVRFIAREGEPLLFSAGRTLDTLVMTESGLKFRERKVISDNDRIHTLIVLPI